MINPNLSRRFDRFTLYANLPNPINGRDKLPACFVAALHVVPYSGEVVWSLIWSMSGETSLLLGEEQVSLIMSDAIAPVFLLGATAGYVSILLTRATTVIGRIRNLNDIVDEDATRV